MSQNVTSRSLRVMSCLLSLCAFALLTAPARPAPKFTVLVSFTGANGDGPDADLVQGSDGNFYGVTIFGGAENQGTVFKVTPAGVLTTLVNFNYPDYAYPEAKLIQGSDGNFYGTTHDGGGRLCMGTVFMMTSAGALTTLHSFNYFPNDGGFPSAGLVQSSDGNFYGTTYQGGTSCSGTVFKMTPGGTVTTLYAAMRDNDGTFPSAGLVEGRDGDFYGTMQRGGTRGRGTVFKITASGKLTSLVDFSGIDGDEPMASLVQGPDGNFYSTTWQGGASGKGTVFRMTPSGALTTLVSFTGANGSYPSSGLLLARDGNFYGTTRHTVFKMTPTGVLTTLVTFSSINLGLTDPGVVQGIDGNLYGATSDGGEHNKGMIFKVMLDEMGSKR